MCSRFQLKKIEASEAVVTGLSYTVASLLFWELLKFPGSWIPTPDFIGLPLAATAIALFVSFGITNDFLFPVLRWLRLTRAPSEVETWLSAINSFRKNYGEYVVVTFRDRRRLFGHIISVSDCQEDGHIYVDDAEWLSADVPADQANIESRVEPGAFLVSLNEVEYLHLIPRSNAPIIHEGKGQK